MTYTVGERLVAVFLSDGEYHAIDDLCPHMGALLGAGEVCDGVVTCPWHAWRFRVADCAWADNPRRQNRPPRSPRRRRRHPGSGAGLELECLMKKDECRKKSE